MTTKDIDTKFESRCNSFFSNISLSDFKEESLENELSLGKSIRERLFLRKRMQQKLRKDITNKSPSKIENNFTISKELYQKCKDSIVNIEQIELIISYFNSDNLDKKYIGLVGIRKLLCNEKPPTYIIFNNNLLPGIISFLDGNYSVEFIYEAFWCLINISYGNENESEKIQNLGAVDKIIPFLHHNLDEIKELAIWCLDNLSYDSLKIRKILANKNILKILITLISTNGNEKIISHCVSVIKYNMRLYSKKIKQEFDIKKLTNIISKLIMNIQYNQSNELIKNIFFDCCYILAHISEHFKKSINFMLENGVIEYIIELMKDPTIESKERLFHCLLKIIGNIICGDANQTKQILTDDIFNILKKHINSHSKLIQKEICWIISNITADTQQNMIKLIDEGFFPLLVELFKKSEKEVRSELIFALCNFSLLADKTYLENLIDNGLLKIICECIKGDNKNEIIIGLEALSNLLSFGEKYNINGQNLIRDEVEKMGMCDFLEKLQHHRNENIYEKAYALVEKFFKCDYF